MKSRRFRMAAALVAAILLYMTPAEALEVSARSALLLDGDTGQILWEKNARERSLIASTTKIMTALVALEHLDLDTVVEVPPEAVGIEGSSMYLTAGERLTVRDLLYGMRLRSGNDAAAALAVTVSGSQEKFAAEMNRKAEELGLRDIHFANPHGLDSEENYATAESLGRLAVAAMKNPAFREIVSTKQYTGAGRTLSNHNKLLWQYPDCTGMKTGYTRQAGRTLVSSAERDGQRLVCVTLNDGDDWRDHAALLDFGFSQFPRKVLVAGGQRFGRVPVNGSLLHDLPVAARTELAWPVKGSDEVRVEIGELPEQAVAPIRAGEIAGEVRLLVNGKEAARTYLVWGGSAGQDVLEKTARKTPLDLLRALTGRETAAAMGPVRLPIG